MKNCETGNNVLKMIPFPLQAALLAPILAIIVTIISLNINLVISNKTLQYAIVLLMYSILFSTMAANERKEFLALNIFRKDDIENEFQRVSSLLMFKTIISTIIVGQVFLFNISPDISLSPGVTIILWIFAFLITLLNFYKGLAGRYRYFYVHEVISKLIEEEKESI